MNDAFQNIENNQENYVNNNIYINQGTTVKVHWKLYRECC